MQFWRWVSRLPFLKICSLWLFLQDISLLQPVISTQILKHSQKSRSSSQMGKVLIFTMMFSCHQSDKRPGLWFLKLFIFLLHNPPAGWVIAAALLPSLSIPVLPGVTNLMQWLFSSPSFQVLQMGICAISSHPWEHMQELLLPPGYTRKMSCLAPQQASS